MGRCRSVVVVAAGLITKRPEDNGWVVAISGHKVSHIVAKAGLEYTIFIEKNDAKPVSQREEARRWRVVGCTVL